MPLRCNWKPSRRHLTLLRHLLKWFHRPLMSPHYHLTLFHCHSTLPHCPLTLSQRNYFKIVTSHCVIIWNWPFYCQIRHNSRVKNLTFMTTSWLRFFDDWFDFLEPSKKYLAPVSLAKIPAFFSRGVNPKWPPASLWKNNLWHIKASNMNKYTFLANSTTRNPFLKSICY